MFEIPERILEKIQFNSSYYHSLEEMKSYFEHGTYTKHEYGKIVKQSVYKEEDGVINSYTEFLYENKVILVSLGTDDWFSDDYLQQKFTILGDYILIKIYTEEIFTLHAINKNTGEVIPLQFNSIYI